MTDETKTKKGVRAVILEAATEIAQADEDPDVCVIFSIHKAEIMSMGLLLEGTNCIVGARGRPPAAIMAAALRALSTNIARMVDFPEEMLDRMAVQFEDSPLINETLRDVSDLRH